VERAVIRVFREKEPKSTEVNRTPSTEKKLLDLAATSGRGTDDLIEGAVAGFYDNMLQRRQHIEEGYLQAERGELTGGDQAKREIQAAKAAWRQEHANRK
jgi:predicted transcriptional regulator